MKVLVIDVGGSHVKVLASGTRTPRRVDSGPTLTPALLVEQIKRLTADWTYEVITLGYPGVVIHQKIAGEPNNLGKGWVDFDFRKAFGRPVKIVNDAAMQALGSYDQGRMLFLGFGTGLGAAMVLDGRLEALELAHLPYRKGLTCEDYAGARGYRRLGRKKWRKHVLAIIALFRAAFVPDHVVVGGGNAKKLGALPDGVRLGGNANAFRGGFRLWQGERRGTTPRRRGTPRAR